MIYTKNLLCFLLLVPIIGILLLLLNSSFNHKLLKTISLATSAITFIVSLLIWVLFDKSTGDFQFVETILWSSNLNINLTVGIDGISLFFVILTTLLIFLCLLSSWYSINFNLKEYLISFLIMEFFLIGVFCVLDLLLFYVFFESVLIPMYLIIGIWGSRERKIRAAYFFFLYTLLGSVLMLLGILYLHYQIGTTDYEILLSVLLT